MKKIIIIIFVILTLSGKLFSQISVSLDQPPPFQFKTEDLWKVTLNNPGTAVKVYLYGSVTKGSSKIITATTSPFNLSQGIKRVNARELSPIDVDKYNNEAERTLNKTGTFESGTYTICVSVLSAETNEMLGNYCNEYEVINMTRMELLAPEEGENILLYLPNFIWLPPAPVPPGKNITYQFQLKEIYNRQSPEYAFLSNPMYFYSEKIRTTLFQYPVSAKPLINGREYAWRVITYIDNVSFLESEIWKFTYNGSNKDAAITNKEIEGQLKEEFGNINNGADFQASGRIDRNENPIKLTDKKPFQFGLSSILKYEYNDKQAVNSDMPRNFGSLTIDPTIKIYDIPFTLNLYLDTRQESSRQNVNGFGFLFDPASLKNILEGEIKKRKEDLTDKIRRSIEKEIEKKKEDLKGKINEYVEDEINKRKNEIEKKVTSSVSPLLKFFSYFDNLGLGETFPMYTANTVNGVKMTGADISFNPGLFYFAVSGIHNLDAIQDVSFNRKMFAGSIGIGSKDKSHFHINLVKSWDNENSINISNLPTALSPKDNLVLGTDFAFNFLKDQLQLKAEINGSMLTRDKTAPDLVSEDFPAFLKNFFDPKISSQFDFMYEVSSKFKSNDFGTNAEISLKSVGPGYVSLGAPNIRQDISSIRFKVSQPFANKKVLASLYYKQDKNNIAKLNSTTSTSSGFGFNFKMNFKDLPYLIIDYRPNSISNDASADSLSFKNNSNVFTITTGINQNEKTYTNSTNIVVTSMSSSSKDVTSDYSILNFLLSNNLTFLELPLNFSISAGYTNNKAVDSRNSFLFDLSAGYVLFEKWSNTIGASYYGEEKLNTKSTIYFNSSYSLSKYLNINLDIQNNFYREEILQYGEYDNLMIRAGVTSNF